MVGLRWAVAANSRGGGAVWEVPPFLPREERKNYTTTLPPLWCSRSDFNLGWQTSGAPYVHSANITRRYQMSEVGGSRNCGEHIKPIRAIQI